MSSILSTDLFSWHSDTRVFAIEASELPRGFRFLNTALDGRGFYLHSERTGRDVWFNITHEEYNDNDLMWWELRPGRPGWIISDQQMREFDKIADLKVIIFND